MDFVRYTSDKYSYEEKDECWEDIVSFSIAGGSSDGEIQICFLIGSYHKQPFHMSILKGKREKMTSALSSGLWFNMDGNFHAKQPALDNLLPIKKNMYMQ